MISEKEYAENTQNDLRPEPTLWRLPRMQQKFFEIQIR